MLEAQEITVRRRGRPVLEGLSLTVPPGEGRLVGGPNGAGKTSPGGAPDPVRITAVDPDGRRHELSTSTGGREARLRELLDAGWAIEEVRSP